MSDDQDECEWVNAPAGSAANLLHSKAVRKPLVHGNHFEYSEVLVLQLSLISEVP